MGACASSPEAKYAHTDDVRNLKVKTAEATRSEEVSEKQSQVQHDAEKAAALKAAQAKTEPKAAEQTQACAAGSSPLDCVQLAEAITCPPDHLIGNLLDPVNGPAAGLPYKVHYLGPPRPPCEAERLATARSLGRIDTDGEDPEISNILVLAKNIFGAPVSLCALFDDQRVFISEQEGDVIPRGDFPWRWTLCGWSLAFKNPQILVIPDTLQDVRFANNHKVVKEPHVRFYCGAPLVASNGHRLGTLCFADVKPRAFDQASCMIMNNLSELVVRQLEKNIALKAKAKDNSELAATYRHLQRAFDAFEHCVVLLDVSNADSWRVLYSNAVLEKLTGLDRSAAVGGLLSDLLEDSEGAALPSAGLLAAVAANKSYSVKLARVRAGASGAGATPLVLHFRPAAKEGLDEHVMPIGVPAFLPATGGDGCLMQKLYFMTVDTPGHSGHSGRSSTNFSVNSFALSSLTSSSYPEAEGLDMGHLLGKGTFGSVYYGTWFGSPVAIKVIESDAAKTGPLLEAVLSNQMQHPLIVSTLKYFHRSQAVASSANNSINSLMHDSAASGLQMGPGSNTCNGAGNGNGNALSTHYSDARSNATPNSNGHTPADGAAPQRSGSNGSNGSGHGHGWMLPDSSTTSAAMTPIVTPPSAPLSANVPGRGSVASDHKKREWRQTVLIMEYADRGSLQEALDRGWMVADRCNVSKGPNIEALLATASEIASALKFLHSNQVVHGDLSGWNIMLCSTGGEPALTGTTPASGGRGFVAKIADFGLARSLDVTAEIMTKNYGTLTHQPPETLTKGIVSKATDVYSFGVLLWQMYTGSRPWSGLSHAQIIMQVGNQGATLKWPKSTPPGLRSLAETCMHRVVSVRPTFEDIVPHLEVLKTELKGHSLDLSMEGDWN